MHANNLRVDKCLAMAAGAGLYWGASMLLSSVWWAGAAVFGEPSFFDSFATMVSLLLVCGALAWSKLFKRKGLQRCLALSGVGFFFLSALYSSIVPSGWEGSPIVLLSLQGCQTGCFIAFWGLGFACLDKREAEKTVLISLVVACAVYGLGSLVPVEWGGVFLAGVLKSLGTLPFLLGLYDMDVVERAPLPENYSLLKPFFASRFFFGVCNGCASCALVFCARSLPNASAALCVILTCIVLGLGLWCSTRLWWATSILRVAPLLAAGVLVFPYLANGSVVDVLAASSPVAIFLSWIMLSSVQLSDIKERIGWDEPKLSFAEKAIYLGGSLVAYLAMFSLCSALDANALSDFTGHVQMASLYAAVVVACYSMANLIERKDKVRVLDKALALSEKQMDIVLEEVSRDYGLTVREGEVFALLARGYSRPALCERLIIAESTARSHTKHVYRKLGIHSKEELYDLVEDRKKRFGSEKGDF